MRILHGQSTRTRRHPSLPKRIAGGLIAAGLTLLAISPASEAARVVVRVGSVGYVRPVPPIWYLPPPLYPVEPIAIYEPPPVVIEQPAYVRSPGGTWYYCERPRGYYPYVRNCEDSWREVPATAAKDDVKERTP